MKASSAQVLMVLPTLGQRPELLRQTLESLSRQKPQKFDTVLIGPIKNKELRKVSDEFQALLIDDPGGLSAAVNVGIAQAKPQHKYVGWIGDDDLLTEGSLSTAVSALDQDPKAVLAFGYCNYIDENGKKLFVSKAGRFAPWIMTWGPNLVPLPGIVFRLSSLKEAGEFDTSAKYAMDLDMLLRLRKIGKFINTQRPQAAFRWHQESLTVSNRKTSLDEAEAIKRRHLPKPLRVFAPLWEKPVRLATLIAVRRVNKIKPS